MAHNLRVWDLEKNKFLNLVVFCLFETVLADMWNPSLAEFEKRSHKLTPGQFFALPKGMKNNVVLGKCYENNKCCL